MLTLLVVAIVLLINSPRKQYENLHGQYLDAIKRLETAETIVRQTRQDLIAQQSLNVQFWEKLKEIQSVIKSVQEKSDEILRRTEV